MSATARSRALDIGFILLLGLTPLLWFEPGSLLKALDFDLPLTWQRLHDNFFYMWDYQSGAGLPRNLHAPALMFFLPAALLQKIGFSLETVQRIFFCFWFTLPGLSFYYLMSGLLRGQERARRAGIWVAVSFYMYNLYLEPIWLGFNMANLSAYVAVPLALGVLIRALEKQTEAFFAGLKVGIIFFFFSAMAQNPSIVLISAVPFVFLLFWHLFRVRSLWFLGKLLFFSLGILFVFNAYWILPEVKKLFDTNLVFEASAKTGGNVAEEVFFASNWLKGISKHTSLLHVLKMQGDWPWYEGFRDYAKNYWSNPVLILLAWFPFALAVVALWKTKHTYKWFFGAMWMVGIIFSMGSHLPFGLIYLWLVKHLPLFWTIRSPWYKFTLLTCLGYGFLMGVGTEWLFGRLKKSPSKVVSSFVYASLIFIFVAASPVYSYPSLLEGRMYRRPTQESTYSNHFKIPPHVLKAAQWLNARSGDARIWDLPSRGISYNTWGYEGFLPLIGYFINAPLFCDNHPLHIPYQGAWGSSWMHLSKLVRNSMEKGLTPYLSNLMSLLRIKYVIQEGDFRYEVLPFPVTRKELNAKLETLVGIKPAGKFTDAWDLWQNESVLPQLYAVPKVSVVNETQGVLIPLSPRMTGQLPAYLLLSEADSSMVKFILEKNLIQEAVLFESTMLDWAVNGMDSNYLYRFVNDPEKGRRQELFKQIEIKEAGEYLILAKKKIPIRETPLRVDVDFTHLPQSIDCVWNKELQGKAAQFKLNGSSQFTLDPEIEMIWKENPSEEWQYLGVQKLDKGIVSIAATMTNRLSSQWDFFIVPKKTFLETFKRALNVFQNVEVGQVYLFVTTSNWNSESHVEQAEYKIEENSALKTEIDPDKNRGVFPFSVGDKAYKFYQGNTLVFEVLNRTEKELLNSLGFKFLILSKNEGTVQIRLNGKNVQEFIAEPEQETNVYLDGLKFPPGKSLLEIKSYSKSVALKELFKTKDIRKGSFGFRELKIGSGAYSQQFNLPVERQFDLKLYPFFGEHQTRELWKNGDFVSSIIIDGKEFFLELEKKGTTEAFLSVNKPVLLAKGSHQIKLHKKAGENYFLIFDSPGKGSAPVIPRVERARRVSPAHFDGTIQSSASCFLVFCDAFDPKWEAVAGKQILSPHFKINGYANAFYFVGGENKNIAIEYIPQRHFIIGIWTTLIGGGLLLLLALLLQFRRKNK